MSQPVPDQQLNFFQKYKHLAFLLLALIGLGLSIASALNLCTTECAKGHDYRLFGLTFEQIGIPFFTALFILELALHKSIWVARLQAALLAGAFGSEVFFIYAQKYIIGHWCPVCLGIAATIALLSILKWSEISVRDTDLHSNQKRTLKMSFIKGLCFTLIAGLGLTSAIGGFAKFDKLAAAEHDLKSSLAFGSSSSPVEVYLFTDWECPACRALEPSFSTLAPKIMKNAKLYFVDMAIHPESLNFTPYNLSFMTNNKDKYLELRDALTHLSTKTKSPSEDQIEQLAKGTGSKFHPLNYSDIEVGIKYFQHLSKQYNIEKTPTLVIVNRDAKKGKKLLGSEINDETVMAAIESLKKK